MALIVQHPRSVYDASTCDITLSCIKNSVVIHRNSITIKEVSCLSLSPARITDYNNGGTETIETSSFQNTQAKEVMGL